MLSLESTPRGFTLIPPYMSLRCCCVRCTDMLPCHGYLIEGRWQVAMALDALDVWQVLVALHQRIVVGLLVQLPMHQRPLLLACLCLHQQG